MSSVQQRYGQPLIRNLAAQVNITSREASVNPGAIDSLSGFAGAYTAFFKDNDGQAPRPVELSIAASKSGGLQPFKPSIYLNPSVYSRTIRLNLVDRQLRDLLAFL